MDDLRLPERIPVFPLSGALLLPNGRLPLNIFEPRYLAMTRDALKSERLIGMVQPLEPERPGHPPALYRTGCVGRITSFSETDDGRYLITLTGLCRYDILEELPVDTPYRQVVVSYGRWQADAEGADRRASPPGRERLLRAFRGYLEAHGLETSWEAIETAPLPALVISLAMLCPFEPNEKQALLEAPDLPARLDVLVALLEMASLAGGAPGEPGLH